MNKDLQTGDVLEDIIRDDTMTDEFLERPFDDRATRNIETLLYYSPPESTSEIAVPTSAAGVDLEQPGILQPIAANVLMKYLYGARMARYDLFRAVCHSASCVTKWNRQNDVDLSIDLLYQHNVGLCASIMVG